MFLVRLKKNITRILSLFRITPIWSIARFFFQGLLNGAITTRASAIAFSFFLAVFPMMLFFFNLIPYIPIENFQEELLSLLKEVMPQNAFLATEETIHQVILKQHFDLLSMGLISMLFFATNGMNSLMSAFGATYHPFKSRNWFLQYLISMSLVCLLSLLVISAVILAIFGKYVTQKLLDVGLIDHSFTYYLAIFGQWFVVVLLVYSAVAIIYYFAPNKRGIFRLFSSGAIFATILMLIFSWGFSLYINEFGQYNKLYGSIGTIIVVLLWFYLNAFSLLLGFELNLSVFGIRKQKLNSNSEL